VKINGSFSTFLQGERVMLQIREEIDQQTTIFTFKGHLSCESLFGIEAAILKAKERGCLDVILDFSVLTGMDIEAMRQLFQWYYKIQPKPFSLSCICPSPHFWESLKQHSSQSEQPEEVNDAVSS
jgi:hypothetical protein